jgi:hypothetical protein
LKRGDAGTDKCVFMKVQDNANDHYLKF